MGLKQAKKALVHGWDDSGDLELTCSLGRARTSLMRVFQSSMSASLRGPGFWGPVACAGAAMMCLCCGSGREGTASLKMSTRDEVGKPKE